MINDFLGRLGEAATSTIALAAYVVVVMAWAFRAWLDHRPRSAPPPRGFPKKDLVGWTEGQRRYQSRILALVAYLCTLITAIIIVSMALFQPAAREAHKPPVLIDSEVIR